MRLVRRAALDGDRVVWKVLFRRGSEAAKSEAIQGVRLATELGERPSGQTPTEVP
jgi:hypothetical protein